MLHTRTYTYTHTTLTLTLHVQGTKTLSLNQAPALPDGAAIPIQKQSLLDPLTGELPGVSISKVTPEVPQCGNSGRSGTGLSQVREKGLQSSQLAQAPASASPCLMHWHNGHLVGTYESPFSDH